MDPKRISATGMAWYERSDYTRILAVMQDSEKLPRTFDEWEAKAKSQLAHLEARGFVIVRATIKPDEFVTWCARNKMAVDSEARRRWGAEFAMRHVTGEDAES